MIMVNKFLLRLYSVDEGSKVRGSIPTNPNVRSDVEVYVADCQLNSNAEVVKVLAKIHIETASLHTSRIWTMYEASHMRGSAYRSRPLWPKFAFFRSLQIMVRVCQVGCQHWIHTQVLAPEPEGAKSRRHAFLLVLTYTGYGGILKFMSAKVRNKARYIETMWLFLLMSAFRTYQRISEAFDS